MDRSLDEILGIANPESDYWKKRGHGCFGRYKEAKHWDCDKYILDNLEGCVACKTYTKKKL